MMALADGIGTSGQGVEVRPKQALDELLQRRRDSAAAIQHNSIAQINQILSAMDLQQTLFSN